MSDNKYSVEDLALSAINKQPLDFKDIFDQIMSDRIQDRVDAKKNELAAHFIVDAPEETETTEADGETPPDNANVTSEEEIPNE